MSMTFYGWYKDANDEPVFIDGPNFSNSNALMLLRTLGYDTEEIARNGVAELDAIDLCSRVVLARAVPPIADDGMPTIQHGNWYECGLAPGYFARAWDMIADLCFAVLPHTDRVTVA